MGTGQCLCAFEVEIVFRNAEVIRVDLLAAHIKFCRFWPKYLKSTSRVDCTATPWRLHQNQPFFQPS